MQRLLCIVLEAEGGAVALLRHAFAAAVGSLVQILSADLCEMGFPGFLLWRNRDDVLGFVLLLQNSEFSLEKNYGFCCVRGRCILVCAL